MGFVQCNFRNVAIVAVDRERLCQPFFLNCIARSHKNSPSKLWKKEVLEQIVGIPRFQLLFARRLLLKRKCFTRDL
jgi:hypothetical protein